MKTQSHTESESWKGKDLEAAAKHTVKVHVWAGISKMGPTKICISDSGCSLVCEDVGRFLSPFHREFLSGSTIPVHARQ